MKIIKVKCTAVSQLNGFIFEPISRQIKTSIVNHLEEFQIESDGTTFLQDYEIENESIFNIASFQRWLKSKPNTNDSIVFKVGAWYFAHLYGWDTHTLFE